MKKGAAMRKLISLTLAAFIIIGVSNVGFAAKHKSKSLYDRLGGKKGIHSVMNTFVKEHVAKDDRINKFFAKTDLEDLINKLTDQVCNAVDAKKCKYKGKDMKTAHQGMGITNEQFDALRDDLVDTLKEKKVAAADIKKLDAVVEGTRNQIVEATAPTGNPAATTTTAPTTNTTN
jgi:hemoglobin